MSADPWRGAGPRPARRGGAAIKLGLVLLSLAIVARLAGMPAVLGDLMVAVAVLLLFRGLAPRLARSGWELGRRHGARGLSAAGRQVDTWWAGRYDRRAERRLGGLRDLVTDEDRADVPDNPVVTLTAPFWRRVKDGTLPAEAGDVVSDHAASPAATRVCVACGNPEYGPRKAGRNWGPLVTYTEPLYGDGSPEEPHLIHQSHFEDESTGFYGRPYKPAPESLDGYAVTNETGGNTMTRPQSLRRGAVSRIAPRHRVQRVAASADAAVSPEWEAIVTLIADFEGESKAEITDSIEEIAVGLAAVADALLDWHETQVNDRHIDRRAVDPVHDAADFLAHAAEGMKAAGPAFEEHYELPIEYADNGGQMPRDPDGTFWSE